MEGVEIARGRGIFDTSRVIPRHDSMPADEIRYSGKRWKLTDRDIGVVYPGVASRLIFIKCAFYTERRDWGKVNDERFGHSFPDSRALCSRYTALYRVPREILIHSGEQ